MTWTICTSGAALVRAGTHVNRDMYTTLADSLSTQAESLIEAETGMSIKANIIDYALSGSAEMACASKIAMSMIAYDNTGYLSREADTLMNTNDADYKLAIKNMKEKNKITLSSPI